MDKQIRRDLLLVVFLGLLALFAAFFGCGPVPPPVVTPPPVVLIEMAVHVQDEDATPVAVATCTDGPNTVTTNEAGNAILGKFPVGTRQVNCSKEGYASGYHIYDVAPGGNQFVTVVLKRLLVTLPRLVPEGQHFRLANGNRITIIEASDFNLFGRYLNGEDIRPVLAQRRNAGFNTLRVWTRYRLAQYGIGNLTLASHPDLYLRLPAFLQLLASYGFYADLTAYTPDSNNPQAEFDPTHGARLCGAIGNATNALYSFVNEGDSPMPPLPAFTPCPGVLSSRGSNGGGADIPPSPYSQWTELHTNGKNEEQRKVGHNAMEIWNGPTVTTETSRFPDVGMWRTGDLARQKTLAFDSAAGAALLAAGSCFHSTHGKNSTLWDANEAAVATAWANGAKSVPLDCQAGGYVHRMDLEGPTVLRAYQRGNDPRCIVVIHK